MRTGLDGAAEHVDEEQHESDRHDRRRDDGVDAARDVTQGSTGQEGGISEEMLHRCSLLTRAGAPVSPGSPSLPWSPMIARKTSSRVGCFSTYSTLAGGSSCLSSARVPFTMIRPPARIAIRSASCSASSR